MRKMVLVEILKSKKEFLLLSLLNIDLDSIILVLFEMMKVVSSLNILIEIHRQKKLMIKSSIHFWISDGTDYLILKDN